MKLQSLTVEQVRQFRAPFTLDQLQAGINLISGPNESGKSTLVQAIRAAFFERYVSSSVDYLQPWGDSSAAPAIELQFQAQGAQWRLNKRFLKQKRCDLSVDGQSFSNDEAEERLARLLGFQFAKKGASKPDHWGIPGLLWVEQGGGQTIEEPVGNASEHLQSALNSLLGEVASSGGDEVILQVERERRELLTAAGKPRAEYAALEQSCHDLQQQLAQMEGRVQHYRERVDRLDILQAEHGRVEQVRPWESQQRNADAAAQELSVAEQQLSEQQRDSVQRNQSENALHAYRDQLTQAKQQLEKFVQRQQAREQAESTLRELQQSSQSLQSACEQARTGYEAAGKALEFARNAERRAELEKTLQHSGEQLQRVQASLRSAGQYHAALSDARRSLADCRTDSEKLERLESVAAELADTRIRLEAIATRVGYVLDEGASLQMGANEISGAGEILLTSETRVTVPGVGVLDITPGGTDISVLRRVLAEQQSALDALLAELGVGSVGDARERARLQAQCLAEIERREIELRAVAPGGLEQLREQLATIEQQRDRHREQLALLPQASEAALAENTNQIPNVELAQHTLSNTAAILETAESQYAEYKLELSRAEVRLEQARREAEELSDAIHSPEFRERQQQLEQQLSATERALAECDQRMADRQRQIDAAQPDLLRQDIERLRRSARIGQEEHHKRAEELAGLRSALASEGAQGLEEQRAALESELAHAQRRRSELERRADALDLLLDLLQTKRQELTRRLQAPLQKHLDHYLGILFPDAALNVNEALVPEAFERHGEFGSFAELSFGAREQMGLIARLAYADLLQEAGRPTLIILDDSLVHSDRQRLAIMHRVLFDAAQRHQILLFTCHPEHWQGLGVAALDLPALKLASKNV